MNDLILNARQRLGAILKHHREERQLSVRNVADRVGVSVAVVEAWERGTTTPSNYQRHKLIKMVNRRLSAFENDFHLAYTEEEAEARQRGLPHKEAIMASNRSGGSTRAAPVTTSLGDKLSSAGVKAEPAAPPPAPPTPPAEPPAPPSGPPVTPNETPRQTAYVRTSVRAPLPLGWRSSELVQRRKDYALNVIRNRPHIKIGGPDGITALLVDRFGVGISHETIAELRAQVHAERGGASPKAEPAQVAPSSVTMASPTPAPPVAATGGDIASAVDLVLSSIPGLRTFAITVDETGEAHVEYTLRETVVETREVERGGSLKVRR